MSAGFQKANSSFRDYAATVLKTPAAKLRAHPDDEGMANNWEAPGASSSFKVKVGHAWGFEVSLDDQSTHQLRGWATPDGAVITRDHNLGLLFVEAGAWTSHPGVDATALAQHIVWSFGSDVRLLSDWRKEPKPPTLQVKPDGSGTLTFMMGYRQPGPGGAGGGPEYVFECTVTLTKDHKAQLTRGKNLNGGQEPPAGLL
jgi:hypothetical protein